MKANQYKFRAWLGDRMEYSVGVSPEGAFYYGGKMKEDSACFNHTFYDENTPIMQSTGLEINGKELYEGDVINTKSNRYVVEWTEGCFCARPLLYEITTPWFLFRVAEFAILLGNIYENPELLK